MEGAREDLYRAGLQYVYTCCHHMRVSTYSPGRIRHVGSTGAEKAGETLAEEVRPQTEPVDPGLGGVIVRH